MIAEHVFQRNSTECGPCCLSMIHAIRGSPQTVDQILLSLGFVDSTTDFTTSIGLLADYLLQRKFSTKVIFGNSRIVLPGWKQLPREELLSRVEAWVKVHSGNYWAKEASALIPYLRRGGAFELATLDATLVLKRLRSGSILLPCLDEGWLWGHRSFQAKIDDIRGNTEGHFVVLAGCRVEEVEVLDPFPTGLPDRHGRYFISAKDAVVATLTWDGMMIEILPGDNQAEQKTYPHVE